MDPLPVPPASSEHVQSDAPPPGADLLRALLENTSDILHVVDPEGRIRYISPSVQRVLGYRPEEMIGRIASDFVHPEDQSFAEGAFAQAVEHAPSTRTLELRLRHRDGSWRSFEVFGQVVVNEAGAAIGLVTSHDITERKRAEDTLRTLVDAAPVPILAFDYDGRVQTWNRAAERMFGWHAAEVIGGPLPSLPEHAEDEFLLLRERILAGETFSGVEGVRKRKDGSAIDVSISAAPLRDAAGQVRGAISVLEDITDRKRLERHRVQAMQFVGHDLRTPLTSIVLNADLLASALGDGNLSDGDRALLQAIVRSAEQMETLVRDLADVGRIEAGGLSLAQVPLAAEVLMRDALTVLQPLARERSIRLELESAPDVRVRGDRDRLLRVISNLVANALRFTPEGGHISLRAEAIDSEVLISVTDTGCGIAEADLPYVFDRYWQAEPGGAGTTGLGLAIVKGIVQAHGGRIWAESRIGEGSAFRFTLPRAHESSVLG